MWQRWKIVGKLGTLLVDVGLTLTFIVKKMETKRRNFTQREKETLLSVVAK
jgi:hypothetical protein